MFSNYFKIAFRVLWKNKVFSAVNIIGLAISMTCCLAIGIYVYNEVHYDSFHTNINNIYRITNKQNQAGKFYLAATTPGPLADALPKDFPEIQNIVRFGNWSGLLKVNGKVYEEKNIQVTENSVFRMFNFSLLKGNIKTVLGTADEIVITEKAALKYFGNDWRNNQTLLGETINVNGQADFKIAGVVANPPVNSSIQFDILLPLAYLFKADEWSYKWGSNNFHTYVQLKPKTYAAAFETKLAKQLKLYNPDTDNQLKLQPLKEQYLYSKFDFFTDWGKRSNGKYVNIFTAVGLLLLLIACINFINLSTARSLKRSMEVGVRKVTGATRLQLIFQFLSESFVITFIAGLIALVLLQFAQPFLNNLTNGHFAFQFNSSLFFSLFIFFITVIGIGAGIYPAFILSSFKPVTILKGKAALKLTGGFRKGLVVFQFAVSVTLMICTFFMYRQLTFMQQKDLGFTTEQMIRVRLGNELRSKVELLKIDLEKQPSIVATAPATMTLAKVDNSGDIQWEGMQEGQQLLITQANVTPDFIPALGIQLLMGANFQKQNEKDTFNNYIVNETAVKLMGFTNNTIIGKSVTFWGAKGTVIGVVKDFHYKPLTAGIEPFIFRYQQWAPYFNLFVKTAPSKTAEAIEQIQKYYKKYEPETPFEFTFLNESINQLYKDDSRTASVILLFSCLTVFVGCMGLFGLTVFAAEQRIKEIGIRKVLGAGIISVTQLLSKDFLKLVMLSVAIALPVAWYISKEWLQNYAYRVALDWWVFATAAVFVFCIALVTISFQAVKAAMQNPVKSLRTE